MMPAELWVYRARLARVVDGDTLDATIDAGFHSYRTERLRLLGVDAPEPHGYTKAAGDAATAFLVAWLQQGNALDHWPLIVRTEKSDVFGRYLAMVFRTIDGACLNADILTSGHAAPFMT